MRLAPLLLTLSATAAFACPQPRLVDVPVSREGALIADDGGVVMVTRNASSATETGGGTLVAGGKRCIPGPGSLAQGAQVHVGWIDLSGRRSDLSDLAVTSP